MSLEARKVKFSNLKIGSRLGLGLFVVILTSALTTTVGVVQVKDIKSRLATIKDVNGLCAVAGTGG